MDEARQLSHYEHALAVLGWVDSEYLRWRYHNDAALHAALHAVAELDRNLHGALNELHEKAQGGR